MEKIEYLELIANRQAPGDSWVLVSDKNKVVHKSLTNVLETWFEMTQEKVEFRLAPLDGKIYVIRTENKEPEPPKRFNIYGDY
jgi:hypothetical protein